MNAVTPTIRSAKHQAALDWAARGFYVFPADENKKPLVSDWQNVASTDPEQIALWWETLWPHANIACVPDKSGCFVVDLDVKHGKDGAADLDSLEKQHGDLPATLTIRTPSYGYHRWFKGRAANSVSKIAPGIDIRGASIAGESTKYGYVLVSGSTIGGKPYEIVNDAPIAGAPAWLLTLANKSRHDPQSAQLGVGLDSPENISRAITRAKQWPVVREGNGSDNAAIQNINELGDIGLNEAKASEITFEHWGKRCGFDSEWIEEKARNAYHYRQSEPGCYAVGSTKEAFGAALDKLKVETPPQTGAFTYSLRDPVADAARPPITYRDPGRLWPDSPGGTVTQLISGPKKHKTNLILAEKVRLMLSGARVLILALEGQYGVTTQRIPALVEHYGTELDTRRGNQTRLEYLRGHFQVANVPRFALDNSESVDALIKFANETGQRARLGGWTDIVIDTQHRAAGSLEENSATDARILWNAVEHIRDGVTHNGGKRCNVTLLHHVGKDESRGGRGSSADEAAVDQVLELKSDKKTLTASVYVKARKDGEDGFTIPFKITTAGASGVPILIPITDEEYHQLSGADEPYSNNKIGAALTELKAVGSAQAVKTHALAVELLRQWGELPKDSAEQEAKARSVGNRLAEKIKKGQYLGYLAHAGGQPVKPYSWSLPEWEE